MNTLVAFTCQEDSEHAALKGRDDSSFPCLQETGAFEGPPAEEGGSRSPFLKM